MQRRKQQPAQEEAPYQGDTGEAGSSAAGSSATNGQPPFSSRGLEAAESVAQYTSVHEYVAAKALQVPDWLAWCTVNLFCSLHLVVPSFLVAIAVALLLCYRGRHIVDFAEYVAAYIEQHLPSQSQQVIHLVEDKVVSRESVHAAMELLACPDGSSTMCRLCHSVSPSSVGMVLLISFLLLIVWPNTEWPLFSRSFQAWFRIFDFEFRIDQSAFSRHNRHLFVCVPHGIVPIGSFMGVSYIRSFLPGINGRFAVASVLFRLPIIRQMILWLGGVPADKHVLKGVLSKTNLFVMTGGIAELFLSNRKEDVVFLRGRTGALHLAQSVDAHVVPVYVFGHTKLFDQPSGENGWSMALSRRIRSSITWFWGRYFLPFPYKHKVTVVVGKPLHAKDFASIAEMQEELVRQVEVIYAEHKDSCGHANTPLRIM